MGGGLNAARFLDHMMTFLFSCLGAPMIIYVKPSHWGAKPRPGSSKPCRCALGRKGSGVRSFRRERESQTETETQSESRSFHPTEIESAELQGRAGDVAGWGFTKLEMVQQVPDFWTAMETVVQRKAVLKV